jgi:hypothetical protein
VRLLHQLRWLAMTEGGRFPAITPPLAGAPRLVVAQSLDPSRGPRLCDAQSKMSLPQYPAASHDLSNHLDSGPGDGFLSNSVDAVRWRLDETTNGGRAGDAVWPNHLTAFRGPFAGKLIE